MIIMTIRDDRDPKGAVSIELPATDDELEGFLVQFGEPQFEDPDLYAEHYHHYHFEFDDMSEEYDIFQEIEYWYPWNTPISEKVEIINNLAEELDRMDYWELKGVHAAVEAESLQAIWNGSSWNYSIELLAADFEEYGQLVAEEMGLPDWAEDYFDYAQFGEDRCMGELVSETSYGLVLLQ